MTDSTETIYQLPTESRSARQSALLSILLLLGFDLLATLAVAAQVLARQLSYPPVFGRPLLLLPSYPSPLLLGAGILLLLGLAVLAWRKRLRYALALLPAAALLLVAARAPLYPPLALFRWQRLLAPYRAAQPALEAATGAGLAALALFSAATAVYGILTLRRIRATGDTHGSSRWATSADIGKTGLLTAAPGLVVGAVRRGWRRRYLRDTTQRHVLLFAPSGTGKSTCLVIPTLLEWPHSAVILDVKGELWHRTSGFRRESLGAACLRFDPSDASGTAARYNPVLAIPPTIEADRHAQALADVLVDPDGTLKARDFWQESAHALLTATLLHVLFAEPAKTLAGCAHLLSDPARRFRDTLALMRATQHDPGLTLGWTDPRTGEPTATHPTVAAVAANLLNLDWRTTSGILATALSHLELFRDPIVARNTETSDFTAEDLINPERSPVSLFLTIPPSELVRLRGLIRIVLNQLAARLTDRLDHQAEQPRRPLLLLLDEFTAIGRIDFLHRAIAYLRGFDIRVFISIQSLSQLYEVYGQHQSITTNCAVQVAYGANDIETARLLSEMTGKFTVSVERASVAGGLFGGRSTYSRAESARPLLTPDEVRRLPPEESIVFVAGHPPIRALRVPYYTDPAYTARAALPPPPVSDRLQQDWTAWTGWQAVLPHPSPSDEPSDPDEGPLDGLEDSDEEESA